MTDSLSADGQGDVTPATLEWFAALRSATDRAVREAGESDSPNDVETIRAALRRLNPEFHASDSSWASLNRLVLLIEQVPALVSLASGALENQGSFYRLWKRATAEREAPDFGYEDGHHKGLRDGWTG